jgi:hypothetical protein
MIQLLLVNEAVNVWRCRVLSRSDSRFWKQVIPLMDANRFHPSRSGRQGGKAARASRKESAAWHQVSINSQSSPSCGTPISRNCLRGVVHVLLPTFRPVYPRNFTIAKGEICDYIA